LVIDFPGELAISAAILTSLSVLLLSFNSNFPNILNAHAWEFESHLFTPLSEKRY
jgi:hypothetical protein